MLSIVFEKIFRSEAELCRSSTAWRFQREAQEA